MVIPAFQPTMCSRRWQFAACAAVLALMFSGGASAQSAAPAAAATNARQINVVQAPIANLAAPQSNIRADVWLDRPDGLYIPGDKLKVYLRVTKDAYVTVLNVNARGETTVLFPNQYAPTNRVAANTVLTLPSSTFDLVVSEPFGGNLVKVIASSSPESPLGKAGLVREQGFDTVQAKTADLARQINVVVARKPEVLWAMSQVVLAVVPKRDADPAIAAVTPARPPEPTPAPVPAPAPVAPPAWTMPALSTAFGVELRTGANQYVAGTPMSVRITPERTCTLSLISYDPSGKPSVLYPNAQVKTTRVSAGKTAFLPSSNARERLVASGVPGVHTLVAVCSQDAGFLSSIFKSSDSNRATVEVATPTNVDALLSGGSGKVGRASVTYTVTAAP